MSDHADDDGYPGCDVADHALWCVNAAHRDAGQDSDNNDISS